MATVASRRRQQPSSTRGSALLEMAAVLPVLLLVLAAIVDFGFLFLQYEVVTNAAREGARIGVLPDYQTADVQQRVRDYLTAGGLTSASLSAIDVVRSTVTVGPSGLEMDVVTVSVEYPSRFMFLGPITSFIGGDPYSTVTLNATSTMRAEQ